MSDLCDSKPSVEKRARQRIRRRILPFLLLLYVSAYLVRVNISFAAADMSRDLRLTPEAYGFGAGVFFIGYVLLEIPGTLLVEKWSARIWTSSIMVVWGILVTLLALITTSSQFYLLRFFIGIAQGGFFPGMIVYLTHWFCYEDRAKAIAMFMAAIPISNIAGALISGVLLRITWFGLSGWRWLLILEALPSILLGIVTFFYLTDHPQQGNWLLTDEREWITTKLEREENTKSNPLNLLATMIQREVVLLMLAYFFIIVSGVGFVFWLPTIISGSSGLSNMAVSVAASLPYAFGLGAMLIAGWSSDRSGDRRWHTAVSMIVASVGILLALACPNKTVRIVMLCLAGAGLYGYVPSFWALPSRLLKGSAAAASVGAVNSVGAVAGFIGPFVIGYLIQQTGSFSGSMVFLSLSAVIAAILILLLRYPDNHQKIR